MSTKELRKTFLPSYFSVEDILASQTPIPCETTVTVPKFGFLDPSQESPNLPKETVVSLPLWAARMMSIKTNEKPSYANVKLPKYFTDTFRQTLQADPAVVDLRKMGPHYYQAGLQLCTLPIVEEEAEVISEVLPEVLQKRVLAMFDSYSLHRDVKSTDDRTNNEGESMLRYNHMDPLELQIFHDSKGTSEELDKWLSHHRS